MTKKKIAPVFPEVLFVKREDDCFIADRDIELLVELTPTHVAEYRLYDTYNMRLTAVDVKEDNE